MLKHRKFHEPGESDKRMITRDHTRFQSIFQLSLYLGMITQRIICRNITNFKLNTSTLSLMNHNVLVAFFIITSSYSQNDLLFSTSTRSSSTDSLFPYTDNKTFLRLSLQDLEKQVIMFISQQLTALRKQTTKERTFV